MNWLRKNLFKRLLLFLSVTVFAFLLLAGGLSLYLRKYFRHPQVLELARKYSRQYLNRDITFESFQFNIFQGLVLKNITVFTNPSFRPSASLTMEELSLRYDFKQLLSGRIVFSHIALDMLEADLEPATVKNEIAYYTSRFSGTNLGTNQKKPSRESRVDLKSVAISGSRIGYLKNTFLIRINGLSLKKGKITRIENDLEVIRSGKKASLKGDVYLFGKSATISQEAGAEDQELFIALQSRTSNFIRFRTGIEARFRKKLFRIDAIHELEKDGLFFPSVVIRDFQDHCFTLEQGMISLKKPEARFRLLFSLKDFSPEYFRGLVSFPSFPFRADLKADLYAVWNPGKQGIPLVSGNVRLDSAEFMLATNSCRILNADMILTKNELKVRQAGLVFRNSLFRFDLFKKDLADPSGDFSVALFSDKAFLPLASLPALYRLEASAEWNLAQKKLSVRNFSCDAFSGHVSAGGIIRYAGPLFFELEPVLKNIRLEELSGLLNAKEMPAGMLQARGRLEFSVQERKVFFRKISGQVSSELDYGDFKGLSVRTGVDYNDEIFLFYDGVCVLRNSQIPFKGSLDLKKGLLKLSGAGQMNLSSLMPDTLKGNLDFTYSYSRGLKDPSAQDLAVGFSGTECFFRQYRLGGLKGEAAVRTNSVRAHVLVDDFCGGRITSSLKGELKEKSFSIESAGERINMAEGVRGLIEGTVTGRMNYRCDVKTAGTNLSGMAELTVVKGEISDTVYQRELGGILGAMQKELSDIFYDRIYLPLTFENRKLRTKKMEIQCPDQVHTLSGEYNLASKHVDAEIILKFNEELVKNAPNPLLALFIRKEGNWYFLKPLLYQGIIGKDARIRFK